MDSTAADATYITHTHTHIHIHTQHIKSNDVIYNFNWQVSDPNMSQRLQA